MFELCKYIFKYTVIIYVKLYFLTYRKETILFRDYFFIYYSNYLCKLEMLKTHGY